MLKSYPLAMQGVEFRGHGVTGIYEMSKRISFVHFAFAAPSEQNILSKHARLRAARYIFARF
ncbi:hypothetical protein [Campylobacter gracilis]|uniref:Uncharacterized protein n=1 Tax=Campylobacter gracilis RM3268 TaxID=553220 RepID=C8PEU0_9BACT|nr:hypothetical protein [Campylobacter gracilis]AKT91866.1 hypothetical protein CGRAC_0401 [Campylobacter gracilis]EEV18568.1 hypothetical protein CAMGR0001_2579 [Campylobacter gracilis RM3268]UEB45929.1 hypothetical protein LK410_02200 [Campylobacter gracilis]SUW77683.1 PQQ repeat-containing protein [Campylobacter gracilis]